MKRADELSEQTRIVIASLIVASFIAALQAKEAAVDLIASEAYIFAISFLGISAALSFLFLMLVGADKKYSVYKKVPFLSLGGSSSSNLLHAIAKEKAFDWSINAFFFTPVLLIASVIANEAIMGPTGLDEEFGPTLYYIGVVVSAFLAWNLLGNLLGLVMILTPLMERFILLRIIFSMLGLILISQVILVLQDKYSIHDVSFRTVLIVMCSCALFCVLAYLWDRFVEKKQL